MECQIVMSIVCTLLCVSRVPEAYHNLDEVFSKQRALSLPPHRPYDSSTDLLSGAFLLTSRL